MVVGALKGISVGDFGVGELGIRIGCATQEEEEEDWCERKREAQNEVKVEIWEQVVEESRGEVSDGGRVVMTRSRS